jgi:hypothetical protein
MPAAVGLPNKKMQREHALFFLFFFLALPPPISMFDAKKGAINHMKSWNL